MQQIDRKSIFNQQPDLYDLEQRLATFGGTGNIELTFDGGEGHTSIGCLFVLDVDEQLSRGDEFPGSRRKTTKTTPNRCHQNTLELFDQDDANIIASGFALYDDGKWYHHSWCVREENGDITVIETTPRDFKKYVGLEYRTPEDVKRFRDWLADAWPQPNLERKPGSLTDRIGRMLEENDVKETE
jgi:hypothetical protein